jgi:hypothetical protein
MPLLLSAFISVILINLKFTPLIFLEEMALSQIQQLNLLLWILHVRSKAGLRSKPAGQLPKERTCTGRQDVSDVIENTVPVYSGFHARNNFSEDYPQIGYVA